MHFPDEREEVEQILLFPRLGHIHQSSLPHMLLSSSHLDSTYSIQIQLVQLKKTLISDRKQATN